IELGLQGLGSAGTTQRNLVRGNALDPPAAQGFTLGQPQRLGRTVHGEDREMMLGLGDNPGQPHVGEVGVGGVGGCGLRWAPGAAEQGASERLREQLVEVYARVPVRGGRGRAGWELVW